MAATVSFVLNVLCFLLVSDFSQGQKSLTYRSSVQDLRVRSTKIPTECSTGVYLICKDCRYLMECVQGTGEEEGSIVFEEFSLQNCTSSETCSSGYCATDVGNTCSTITDSPFICGQYGTFPDPVDCAKYYICNRALVAEMIECPKDGEQAYGFNPRTLLCNNKLLNNKCSGKPVPDCLQRGQSGPITSNPYYHYRCVLNNGILYPLQMICPYNKVYQATRKGCV